MEVYIEVTYLINLFIILFSFEILCFLLNIQILAKNLFIYCLIYNISFILLYIDFFDGFLFLYFLVITYVFFRKRIYIYYPIYMFIYISVVSFLNYLLPESIVFQGILLIDKMEISSVIIIAVFFLIVAYFYVSFTQHHMRSDIVVKLDNNLYKGIVDTGNRVWYKGYPLIFISDDLLNNYEVIDHIYVETAYQEEEVDIVLIKKIDINFETFYNVYAGKMKLNEYDCILNMYLLGGVI